jgi:uncharacterized protein YkwD
MYRVVLPAFVSLLAGACSLGNTVSFSHNQDAVSPRVAGEAGSAREGSIGLGGEPSVSRTTRRTGRQTASLQDKAPNGTFESAPRGALADRDYSATDLSAQRARDLVNGYRKSKGLRPLTLDAQLTAAAKAHAKDLAKWDRISHYGSDGSNPWDRVKRTGYGAKVAAENVGTGQASLDEVFKGWQKSPGHNRNLLMSDVEHMGIALVQDPKTEFKTFWVLTLAARL